MWRWILEFIKNNFIEFMLIVNFRFLHKFSNRPKWKRFNDSTLFNSSPLDCRLLPDSLRLVVSPVERRKTSINGKKSAWRQVSFYQTINCNKIESKCWLIHVSFNNTSSSYSVRFALWTLIEDTNHFHKAHLWHFSGHSLAFMHCSHTCESWFILQSDWNCVPINLLYLLYWYVL